MLACANRLHWLACKTSRAHPNFALSFDILEQHDGQKNDHKITRETTRARTGKKERVTKGQE
jgi:hypothetical protein